MIPEIGHFALILALCLAFVQTLVPYPRRADEHGPVDGRSETCGTRTASVHRSSLTPA